MSAREDLIHLLQSKRSKRMSLLQDVAILDGEIKALESVRDQLDRMGEVRPLVKAITADAKRNVR